MTENNNFLRKIPLSIDQNLIALLSSLGFAIDNLNYAYTRMRQTALILSDAPETEWIDDHHISLFGHAWSMIDQIYAIRTIGRRLPKSKENPLNIFIDESISASLARNYMDHLSEKIDNLVKSKKDRPPLFGALSFRRLREHHIGSDGSLLGYEGLTLMSTIAAKPSRTRIVGNSGLEEKVEYPIGFFELQVEDMIVPLSAAFLRSQDIVSYFNDTVGPSLNVKIKEAALEKGLDPEAVLKSTTSLGPIFRSDIKFEI